MNFLFKTLVVLNKKGENKTTGEIMTVVVMAVIFMLYLPLIIVLLRSRTTPQLSLPREFAFGILLLMATIWLLHLVKGYKEADQYNKLRRAVIFQLSLACVFLLVQLKGAGKILFGVKYSEVKIIAVLVLFHVLHLGVLIGMHLKWLFNTRTIHSPTDCYIYFLHPGHNFAFRLNLLFWNFLCLLWIGLYVLCLFKLD